MSFHDGRPSIGVTRERVRQILAKSQRNMQAKAARLGIENLTEAL